MSRRPSFARILGGGVAKIGRALTRVFGQRIGSRAAAHAAAALAPVVIVRTSQGQLRFWCGSEISAKRALGMLRQEPDTLAWLDEYLKLGEHLWDVGANVGVYGLYACLRPDITVTCFEPVAATFAILARNVAVNGVGERLSPLCLALSDTSGVVPLYLSGPEPGSSMHALKRPQNVRGSFKPSAVQPVLAMRGDRLVSEFGVEPPRHLKVDVDGHERQVLEGLGALLAEIRTVWIEMTEFGDADGENGRIRELLGRNGFVEQTFAPAQRGRNRLFVNREKVG